MHVGDRGGGGEPGPRAGEQRGDEAAAARGTDALEAALLGVEGEVVGEEGAVAGSGEVYGAAPLRREADAALDAVHLGERGALALLELAGLRRAVALAIGDEGAQPWERGDLQGGAWSGGDAGGGASVADQVGGDLVGSDEVAEAVVDVVVEHIGAGAPAQLHVLAEAQVEVGEQTDTRGEDLGVDAAVPGLVAGGLQEVLALRDAVDAGAGAELERGGEPLRGSPPT